MLVCSREQPMICSDQPDRQSVQTHRPVLLVAEMLVEVEIALVVSEILVEKEMMLPGSMILDEVEKMVLYSDVSVGSWCFWDPFSWLELDGARGHRHLTFERFWS